MIGIICILAVIVVFIWAWYVDGIVFGFAAGFVALIIAGIIFGIAVCITWGAFREHQPDEGVFTKTNLLAISNSESVEGRFFLGSGYINGQQVFSYIEDHDEYAVVDQVNAGSTTRIYEDAGTKQPWMTVQEYTQDAWFLWPGWHWGDVWMDTYEFHIPKDSIVSDYEVDVNK